MGGGYLRFRSEFLANMPTRIATKHEQDEIVDLVNKLMERQQRKLSEKSSERIKLAELEIDRVLSQLNQKVYDLYGIKTDEEKKIIKESLK